MEFKTKQELLEYVADNCVIEVNGNYYFNKNVKELTPSSSILNSAKNQFAEMLWDKLIPKNENNKVINKMQNGYAFIPSKNDFVKKMNMFQAEYPQYDPDIIAVALKTYIDYVYNKNPSMFKTLKYFILHKEQGSMLASYCEAVNAPTQNTAKNKLI